MAGEEINKIDRLIPQQVSPKKQQPIQGENLQVPLNTPAETTHLQNADTFNKLLSYYKQLGHATETSTGNIAISEQQSLQKATREAEVTFNTMMEISKQLQQTSRDILEMNSK